MKFKIELYTKLYLSVSKYYLCSFSVQNIAFFSKFYLKKMFKTSVFAAAKFGTSCLIICTNSFGISNTVK